MIKKLFLLATLAALTLFGFSAAAQNPVYLSSLKPVDSDSGTIGTAWLTVKADGKIIYEYEITENSFTKEISLDIDGAKSDSTRIFVK